MGMARYHYTRENENGVVLYLESEPAEDAMDEFDDEIAVGFSGNGYLSFDEVPQGGGSAAEWSQACGGRQMRNHRYVHGRGKDLEGGALAMDIHSGHPGGCPFAMHNMQDVWSFPLISCFPACWYASLLYL